MASAFEGHDQNFSRGMRQSSATVPKHLCQFCPGRGLAQPYFFGATLTALNKKDGGVRPIAVGCTLRRLVAKCAGARIMTAMGAHLAPHQLWGSYGGGGSCPCGSHFPPSPAAGPSPFET